MSDLFMRPTIRQLWERKKLKMEQDRARLQKVANVSVVSVLTCVLIAMLIIRFFYRTKIINYLFGEALTWKYSVNQIGNSYK